MAKIELAMADEDPVRRLQAIDGLRDRYVVHPIGPEDDALRVVRAKKPAVAVVVMSAAKPGQALRISRALKTEYGYRPLVLVVNRWVQRINADEVRLQWLADGYLEGAGELSDLEHAVRAMLGGELPFERIEPRAPTKRRFRFWKR